MSNLVPLKRVVHINPETLPDDTPPGYEFRYVDIGSVVRGQLVEQPAPMTFVDAPSRARRVIRPGDTIVSTVRTYLRAVLPVHESGLIASTGFACLRPRGEVEPRFLSWWAQSDEFIEEIVARSVGVSYPAINPSEIGLMRFPMRPLAEQRAIADYLDSETVRIDALIAKKQRLRQLLGERLRVARTWSVLGGDHGDLVPHRVLGAVHPGWTTARLKHVIPRIGVGVVVNPSDYVSDVGVPFLRGSDVLEGEISLISAQRISEENSRMLWRSRLDAGDVVVVRAGDPGRAAVVPEELAGANCASVLILKRGERLRPDFLAAFMNSSAARHQVDSARYGAAQEQINVGHIVDFILPVPDVAEQDVTLEQLRERERAHARLVGSLERQVDLLREHRQGLITAAVTGELEVPGDAA